MTTTEFILGLTLILVVFVLMLVALLKGRTAKSKMKFGEVFNFDIEVGPSDRAEAAEATRRAAQEKGQEWVASAEQEIESLSVTRLARVLWADDHPDNNIFETVALERTGVLVTTAASAEAGEFYLRQLSPALVITDRDVGLTLVDRVSAIQPNLPVIVYTANANRIRDDFLAKGATAVVDTVGDLMAAVQSHRPDHGGRASTIVRSGRQPSTHLPPREEERARRERNR